MTGPGFKETADLFARCARKERDPVRRAEHIKSEAFYRSLARVTPSFPPGYKWPALNGDRYLDRAEMCRAIAESLCDPDCRRQMIGIAETYESIARQVGHSFERPQ